MKTEHAQEALATLARQLEQAETLGDWQKPWHAIGTDCLPIDPTNGRKYGDEDWLNLWDAQVIRGYTTNFWTSRRRWRAGGGLVRKGESGTPLSPPSTADWKRRRLVFNADQQDGFLLPHQAIGSPSFCPDPRLDAWFARTGIPVTERGGRALYSCKDDLIVMPERKLFVGNDCITAKEAWYAALAHEHVHATGHASRLGRDMSAFTGSPDGAFEDMIADIGAALLMAEHGMPTYRTPHHARYLAYNRRIIRDPKQNFLAAAAKAQQAVDWLMSCQ